MDSDIPLRLVLLFLMLMGAAYFASSEIAYASLNRIRVKNYAENGDKRAARALYISDNFDRALTTILIGNNITHIGFAALVTLVASQLWGVEAVKYATFVSTILIFLFSEMIPKSFGKSNLKYALTVSASLSFLMKLLWPINYFFTKITNKIIELLPETEDEPEINREEFYEIIKRAEEDVLDQEEKELIYSALEFDTRTVGDVYVPKENVVALDISSSNEDILNKIKNTKFSRLPVYEESLDNIAGILPSREFLKKYIKKEPIDIRSLLLKPHFSKKDFPIDDLLKDMSHHKIHLSIVVNDAKETLGIITVEDILEELVGDIWDEDDIID